MSPVASSMRRCVEVVDNIEGQAIDICLAGRHAALHIYTAKGRVVVRLSRTELLEKILAGHDANGVPFVASSEGVMARLVADAEATAPKSAPVAATNPRSRAHGEVATVCRQLWDQLVAHPQQNLEELALAHGIRPGAFRGWISQHHPGGVTELRGGFSRVPRAKGQSERAERGLPLVKPSATGL